MDATAIIHQLALQKHPEGGYFKETYRSAEVIPASCLPPSFGGDRHYSTTIYYLLQQGDFSAFHRIKSDEGWHFYAGQALLVHVIHANGRYQCITLGSRLPENETFQFVVPANCWFASEPAPGTDFSLVGCSVSPGFDFADFELAEKNALESTFPQHRDIIRRLCR